MFGLLKKKITGFIDGLTKKEEEKGEPPEEKELTEEIPEPEREEVELEPEIPAEPEKAEKPETEIPREPLVKEEPELKEPEPKIEEPRKEEKPEPVKEERPEPKKETPPEKKKETPPKKESKKEVPVPKVTKKPEPKPVKEPKKAEPAKPKVSEKPKPRPEPKEEPLKEEKPEPEIPTEPAPLPEPRKERPKERIKLSPLSMIKSFVTSEVEIKEGDVGEMLDNLELELLEGDVDMEVATSIKDELKEKLIGAKVKKKELHGFIKSSIRDTLADIMSGEQVDLLSLVESSEKPVKIVFLGVNGSGKTTTIAKVAHMLQSKGYKVVFAAADTFRAAAIEQIGVHAERLGVKLIKRDYGADPTSVAYDAVNYAGAHGIDVVLIDTAGRQDTNINLINELKKMNRVIKPDLRIYVGESIAGNAILEQLGTFHQEIGVDGVVLTKLDCDPKGGTMLSISRKTGVPIIYIGTGQKYDELERFDANEMADRIVG